MYSASDRFASGHRVSRGMDLDTQGAAELLPLEAIQIDSPRHGLPQTCVLRVLHDSDDLRRLLIPELHSPPDGAPAAEIVPGHRLIDQRDARRFGPIIARVKIAPE